MARVKGLDTVTKNLMKTLAQMEEVSKEGLKDIAQEILDESNKFAPKDTEELVNSSYIADEESNSQYTVEIGYTLDRALWQHENYGDAYLDPTTPGTIPKFLQVSATKKESEILEELAERIRSNLK